MENRKTTLDREPISSEYIKGKQNLNQVLKGHRAMKPPLWKTVWFYGPVGLATAALIVAASNMKNEISSISKDEQRRYNIEEVQLAKADFFSEATIKVTSKKQSDDDVILYAAATQSINEEAPVESGIEPTKFLPPIVENTSTENIVVENVPAIPVEKTRNQKTMPNIAGIITGKLNIDDICEANGIACNNGFKVYSYDVQYYNGYGDVIERVRGDKFPPFLCHKLRTYNVNQQVMITNILAKHPDGSIERLISMRIEPTF